MSNVNSIIKADQTFRKNLGAQIKKRRRELNFTQQELADAIGIDKSTISSYENGAIELLKMPVVQMIASALSTNLEQFIYLQSTQKSTDDKSVTIPEVSKNNIKLKELRRQHNLTQAMLAAEIGVAQNTLSYWENKQYDIDSVSLIKLADYFGCSVDYILGRENPKPKLRDSRNSRNLTQQIDDLLTPSTSPVKQDISFSKRLREVRKNSGMTQSDFSEAFQFSAGTIAMWETGKRQPDFETLIRIARYFNVSTDYLLGLDSIPTDCKFEQALIDYLEARNYQVTKK